MKYGELKHEISKFLELNFSLAIKGMFEYHGVIRWKCNY